VAGRLPDSVGPGQKRLRGSLSCSPPFGSMATPMFSWLFGKKDQATRGEDAVGLSDAARLNRILCEVERLVKQGCSVVVVAWTLPTFDHLARALDQYKPLLCRDLFGFDALRAQLARAGSVAVALANTLSSDVKTLTDLPVVLLVYGLFGRCCKMENNSCTIT
jgi:hypothetical protein